MPSARPCSNNFNSVIARLVRATQSDFPKRYLFGWTQHKTPSSPGLSGRPNLISQSDICSVGRNIKLRHRPLYAGDPIFPEGDVIQSKARLLYNIAMNERQFHVYILASKPWGTLYTGVTGDLQARVWQHKQGMFGGFTKKYSVKILVYFEAHATAMAAIHREKRIKKWPRAWKINLIRTDNPDWLDLAADWYPQAMTKAEVENWVARIKRAMTNDKELQPA